MKNKSISKPENRNGEIKGAETVSLQRAKEIMTEEGLEYTDEEVKEILDFLSKVITITTAHYERKQQKEAKIISINTKTTHEKESLPLHTGEYRRAS